MFCCIPIEEVAPLNDYFCIFKCNLKSVNIFYSIIFRKAFVFSPPFLCPLYSPPLQQDSCRWETAINITEVIFYFTVCEGSSTCIVPQLALKPPISSTNSFLSEYEIVLPGHLIKQGCYWHPNNWNPVISNYFPFQKLKYIWFETCQAAYISPCPLTVGLWLVR